MSKNKEQYSVIYIMGSGNKYHEKFEDKDVALERLSEVITLWNDFDNGTITNVLELQGHKGKICKLRVNSIESIELLDLTPVSKEQQRKSTDALAKRIRTL